MATIPTPGSELRHVRKTVTFTGGANAGLLGSEVPVFTTTGRVGLRYVTGYISTSLACTVPSLTALAFTLTGKSFTLYAGNPMALDANDPPDAGGWMALLNGSDVSSVGSSVSTAPFYGFEGNVVLVPTDKGGGADITAGVLVIDAWYTPITDDGALAGDDIDEDLKTNIWSKALSDISSVPAITASALSGLNWLFALARNKRTQTATTETVYKDDGSTSLSTSTKSDDGTTFTRGKYS